VAEVRRRLRRADVPEATVDQVVAHLSQLGLVDDAAFAAYWVTQRRTFKPRGARLVRAELRQLGVDAEVVSGASAALAADPVEDAYRAASRRARQLATCDDQEFRRRLSQFLTRRGFDWPTITPVIARLLDERE
jgi:regulatory protein